MRITEPLAGALALMSLGCVVVAAGARFVPYGTPITDLARIFDSLAPFLLIVSGLCVLGMWVCRSRRMSLFALLATLAATVHLFEDHRAVSLPLVPDARAELRVLFFNVLSDNAAANDRIVSAVLAADPDIVAFAEGQAMYPALRRLGGHYRQLTDCTLDECQILVFSKPEPLRHWVLDLSQFAQQRYVVVEIPSSGENARFVVFNHLTKPWFSGIAEAEHEKLTAQYDWLGGDVVAMGDYNAAPWSYQMLKLLSHTGFRAQRRPAATWPSSAGNFGMPIDQVLVHGNARVVASTPFGSELGSNHRGLLVDITFEN